MEEMAIVWVAGYALKHVLGGQPVSECKSQYPAASFQTAVWEETEIFEPGD